MRECAPQIPITDRLFERMRNRWVSAAFAEQVHGHRDTRAAGQDHQAPTPGQGSETGTEGRAPGGSEGPGDGPEGDRQGPGDDSAEGR
eukprot:10940391-Alexandrium_andersonii.AAC.1